MNTVFQSLTDPDFVQNPYGFYDHARALGDVVFWHDYKMPAAFSHRAVGMLLKDRRMGREAPPLKHSKRPGHLTHWCRLEDNSMLELEPPRHTRLRGLVLRAFTGKRVMAMAEQIKTLSHALIDAFPPSPQAFDFLDAFARPLPVIIISRLLGVPEEDRDNLLSWSNAMVAMYQSNRTRTTEDIAEQACRTFIAYLGDYIAHRRRHPRDDLISELIAAETDGDRLSADELLSTCILLLNAGHEATVHTFGNALNMLVPRAVRQITQTCVEEILRFDPPLHVFTRWSYDDINCFGTIIAKHTEIACVLASANRDSAVFIRPNAFIADRSPHQHHAFGAGIHFCVGAPLARLEIRIGLQTLLTRCPHLRLSEPPQYANSYHFHGLERVMIQI